MEPLIQLDNIRAAYDKNVVLNQVNLTVHANDFIGIIGPNGGGKTTLLKIILNLIQPLSGRIIKSDSVNIGYLPQVNTIDKQFPVTIKDVILSGRFATDKWWKRANKEQLNRVDELLEFIGLDRSHNVPIGELSGGQMQRVFLCRALISKPNLLILDEPNTYVDKTFEANLYNLLGELNEQMAILLVSHDVGTISSMVKTIACVNGGLHYHPSNKITNEILQSYNCPIELVSHGHVPHRVLKHHDHE
ncbi:metal ABC transporter ATP-binding protein [Carboxylicivirga mesophila]|uniref:Metal ABC transporter ATP-binding protein n=1 Tax=Carboxylicivirga mesophila TaxID=1166478 RepID=A0ABS5K6J3_9BACT|nr:metal ABC transporter ATP-binding protein [Carboxylicivirga mesophila]MBS2210589.1 metal ABC transporter ATP-binding protein [Carboxylicivirga mesophila]